MRACLALPLLAFALAVFAPLAGHAAEPIVCRQLNAGLSDAQRPQLDRWMRQAKPGGDFTVDYTCSLDDKRAVVAVADYNGLSSAVYVASFSDDDGLRMRRLFEERIETPVIFPRPGGGHSLVHVVQQPERGLMRRAFRATDLAEGQTQILYEAHYDARGGGCRATPGVPRVLLAIAARPSDVNKDGIADLIIDREEEDCATSRIDRRELVFLATPEGFRPRP